MHFTKTMFMVSTAFAAHPKVRKARGFAEINAQVIGGMGYTRFAGITPLMTGYGCWCHFNDMTKSRGAAVDEIDQLCKTLHNAYVCIGIDDSSCSNPESSEVKLLQHSFLVTEYSNQMDIYEEIYRATYYSDGTATEAELAAMCQRMADTYPDENTNCFMARCVAEFKFVHAFHDYVYRNSVDNVPKWQANGVHGQYLTENFDFENNCIAAGAAAAIASTGTGATAGSSGASNTASNAASAGSGSSGSSGASSSSGTSASSGTTAVHTGQCCGTEYNRVRC
jgi:uncharacterized membrane protein YgcG